MTACRVLAIAAVTVLFAGQVPLVAQPLSQDSITKTTERYAPQVDSVRRASSGAVLLVVAEHGGKLVRGAAFPLREKDPGNFNSVSNCFPEISPKQITWTTVALASGTNGPLRPDWTYLLYAKLKQPPTGGPLPPNADCGRR